MTVVHNHPHPKAMQVLTPSNTEIAKTYGQVRVEDWDDRVAGLTWQERNNRGNSLPIQIFISETNKPELSSTEGINEVVRCHSTTTGQMILLHSDWL